MTAPWSPLSLSLSFALLFAALYEPVRLALLPYHPHSLGGVGGVGGLANLQGPEAGCSTHQSPGYQGNYCYQKGIGAGPFTILAWITLLCWVGPWFVGASANALGKPPRTTAATRRTSNDGGSPDSVIRSFSFVSFQVFWIGINALWFLVPLTVFWNSLGRVEEITSLARYVLAVSLAAAHPLSWNLMIVAIPVSGVLTLLVDGGLRSDMFQYHRFVAYTTALWACMHGTFEVLYLVISKSSSSGGHHSKFYTAFNIWQDGENLIYVFGLLAYVVFACHVVASYFRKTFRDGDSFRWFHRTTALLLLMIAAAHWWPFAILCLPTTALHGCGAAIHIFYTRRRSHLIHQQQQEDEEQSERHLPVETTNPVSEVSVTAGSSLCEVPSLISRRKAAVLLLVSLVGSWTGLYYVWSWRQTYMMSSSANLYLPFAFPPMSILLSGLAAMVAVLVVLTLTEDAEVAADTNSDESATRSPLLPANESHRALENGGRGGD